MLVILTMTFGHKRILSYDVLRLRDGRAVIQMSVSFALGEGPECSVLKKAVAPLRGWGMALRMA